MKNLYDSAYFKKLQEKSSYFLLIKWMDMKKHHWKSRQMEFWKIAHTIYTCDTTLHFCYKRMHLFSANQKLVIFSCTLSKTVIIWCKCFRWLHEVTLRYILPKRVKGRLKITPRYTLPKRVLDRLKITPMYTLPKKV